MSRVEVHLTEWTKRTGPR